jgi:imidazolonepropionase-like amidohydrolase
LAHRFPALIAAPAAGQERIWLTGARLFDGTGSRLRENAAILIQDGIIRRVADAAEPCPDGAWPLEVGQRVLMPGLTDAHTHASGTVPQVAKGAEEPLPGITAHFLQAELRDYLRLGVTTIRVVGSQGLLPQQARQAMRYGAFRGPRLLTCAKIVSATAPGGRFYGDMYREADGQDDMRRAVREQIGAGADFIKVMTTGARSNELEDPDPLQLTDPELAAVTDEAHRMGFRVAAHAEGLDGCAAAIRHGVDTIEHGMYLHRRPDLLDVMAASGQVLVPTLSGYYWMAGLGEEVIDPAHAEAEPDMPPVLVELAQRNLEEGAASMRAARQAGVKIALGSDTEPGRRARDPADDPPRPHAGRGPGRRDQDRRRSARAGRAHRHRDRGQAGRPDDHRWRPAGRAAPAVRSGPDLAGPAAGRARGRPVARQPGPRGPVHVAGSAGGTQTS